MRRHNNFQRRTYTGARNDGVLHVRTLIHAARTHQNHRRFRLDKTIPGDQSQTLTRLARRGFAAPLCGRHSVRFPDVRFISLLQRHAVYVVADVRGGVGTFREIPQGRCAGPSRAGDGLSHSGVVSGGHLQ